MLSQPRIDRLALQRQHAEDALVNSPQHTSDDSTSVGKKCFPANVLLPEPLGPVRMTKERLGIVMGMVDAITACC